MHCDIKRVQENCADSGYARERDVSREVGFGKTWTHRIPVENIATSPSLVLIGSWSGSKIGMGRMMSKMSVARLFPPAK